MRAVEHHRRLAEGEVDAVEAFLEQRPLLAGADVQERVIPRQRRAPQLGAVGLVDGEQRPVAVVGGGGVPVGRSELPGCAGVEGDDGAVTLSALGGGADLLHRLDRLVLVVPQVHLDLVVTPRLRGVRGGEAAPPALGLRAGRRVSGRRRVLRFGGRRRGGRERELLAVGGEAQAPALGDLPPGGDVGDRGPHNLGGLGRRALGAPPDVHRRPRLRPLLGRGLRAKECELRLRLVERQAADAAGAGVGGDGFGGGVAFANPNRHDTALTGIDCGYDCALILRDDWYSVTPSTMDS